MTDSRLEREGRRLPFIGEDSPVQNFMFLYLNYRFGGVPVQDLVILYFCIFFVEKKLKEAEAEAEMSQGFCLMWRR